MPDLIGVGVLELLVVFLVCLPLFVVSWRLILRQHSNHAFMHKRNTGLIKLGKIIFGIYVFFWIPFDIYSHLLRSNVEPWLTPTLSAYFNSSFLFAFYLVVLLRFWHYFLNVKNMESVAFQRHRSITQDDTRAISSNANNKNGNQEDMIIEKTTQELKIEAHNEIVGNVGGLNGYKTNQWKQFSKLLKLFFMIWIVILIITGITSFSKNSTLVLKLTVDGSIAIFGIITSLWMYYRIFIKPKHDQYAGFSSFNFYFFNDQWFIKQEFILILLNCLINFVLLLIISYVDYSHYSQLYAIWLGIILETLMIHDFLISTFIVIRLNKHNINVEIDVIDGIIAQTSVDDQNGLNLDSVSPIAAPVNHIDKHRSFEELYNELIEFLSTVQGYDKFLHFLEKEFESANLIFVTELLHFRDYLFETCLLGDAQNHEIVDTLGFLFINVKQRHDKKMFVLPNQVPRTMLAEKYNARLFKQSKEQYFYNIFVTFNVIYQKYIGNIKSPMNLSNQLNDEIKERIEDRYQILSDKQCIETEEEIGEIWIDLMECGKIIWNLLILSYARMKETSNLE